MRPELQLSEGRSMLGDTARNSFAWGLGTLSREGGTEPGLEVAVWQARLGSPCLLGEPLLHILGKLKAGLGRGLFGEEGRGGTEDISAHVRKAPSPASRHSRFMGEETL